ncbi:hypothetical protein WJX77_003451 [Trebouxia sp. C0004]
MPSLSDLHECLLSRIAVFCDLESAGYLSLVNKQVSEAVTPVLPSLCDVNPLRLLLPHDDDGVVHGDLPSLPLHRTWGGLAFTDRDEFLQLAVGTARTETLPTWGKWINTNSSQVLRDQPIPPAQTVFAGSSTKHI